MFHAGTQLKKALIIVHRWMGVSLCLLFLTWFASGMVLMYWDYPAVSEADRLSRAPVLDAAAIRLSPQEAYSRLQTDFPPDQVKLGTFDGRPAYRFRFGDAESIVSAVDGQTLKEFPPEMTLRIASSWTGQPPADAKMEENMEEDKWTVSGEFQDLRPMRKYSWPDGEQVYVSTVTGDVEQYTTRASRMGAYFGAIPHWLYFTPLRKHSSAWARIVIWASGLGTVAALCGILIGISTYSPSKQYRREGAPSSLPYSGQKRWHAILGLIFGLLACSWAFSGMLSMDPFPRLQGENWDSTGARLGEALRGGSLRLADFTEGPREALGRLGRDFRVKELQLDLFAGEPAYLVTGGENQSRIVPVRGEVAAEYDRNKIIDVIGKAAQPHTIAEVRLVTQYEAYYVDRRRRRPLPVIFVRLSDKDQSIYYIDPKTARIVQSYNSRARWNRWLYHGLHSMDFPWLYNHRPIWDILVLILLTAGSALCVTSLVLAWRVVQRSFGQTFLGPR
jgi:hypothetical protein